MSNTPWFYNPRFDCDALAKAHAAAYEKSLKSTHAVKAQAGTYYYKGWEIAKDGGRECPWSYSKPGHGQDFGDWAETKKLAMAYIDDIIETEEETA